MTTYKQNNWYDAGTCKECQRRDPIKSVPIAPTRKKENRLIREKRWRARIDPKVMNRGWRMGRPRT